MAKQFLHKLEKNDNLNSYCDLLYLWIMHFCEILKEIITIFMDMTHFTMLWLNNQPIRFHFGSTFIVLEHAFMFHHATVFF